MSAAFVDRHELVGGFDRDRLDEALERLREHDVENVLVSMCDGSGVSRNELARFHAAVTDWERAEYLELA